MCGRVISMMATVTMCIVHFHISLGSPSSQGHRHSITCTCASDNRRWIATADQGPNNTVIVWDSYSGCVNPCYSFLVVEVVVVVVLMILIHNEKVVGLILGLRPFCVEFAMPPCVCESSLWVLWPSPSLQKHTCELKWRL